MSPADPPLPQALAPDADDALVLPFERVGAADVARVGGKGASLGEKTRAGLPVPPGFCATTAAFRRVTAGDPEHGAAINARLDARSPHLRPDRGMC